MREYTHITNGIENWFDLVGNFHLQHANSSATGKQSNSPLLERVSEEIRLGMGEILHQQPKDLSATINAYRTFNSSLPENIRFNLEGSGIKRAVAYLSFVNDGYPYGNVRPLEGTGFQSIEELLGISRVQKEPVSLCEPFYNWADLLEKGDSSSGNERDLLKEARVAGNSAALGRISLYLTEGLNELNEYLHITSEKEVDREMLQGIRKQIGRLNWHVLHNYLNFESQYNQRIVNNPVLVRSLSRDLSQETLDRISEQFIPLGSLLTYSDDRTVNVAYNQDCAVGSEEWEKNCSKWGVLPRAPAWRARITPVKLSYRVDGHSRIDSPEEFAPMLEYAFIRTGINSCVFATRNRIETPEVLVSATPEEITFKGKAPFPEVDSQFPTYPCEERVKLVEDYQMEITTNRDDETITIRQRED